MPLGYNITISKTWTNNKEIVDNDMAHMMMWHLNNVTHGKPYGMAKWDEFK